MVAFHRERPVVILSKKNHNIIQKNNSEFNSEASFFKALD